MSAPTRRRGKGFAAMDPNKLKAISSQAGRKAHELGKAHRFTSAEAAEAGRKGGSAARRRKAV